MDRVEGRPGRQARTPQPDGGYDRRTFLSRLKGWAAAAVAGTGLAPWAAEAAAADKAAAVPKPVDGDGPTYANGYRPIEHYYGMGIDVDKCIGCGRCAEACKAENDVPREPFFFRTWVERYTIKEDGTTEVESPNGGIDGFTPQPETAGTLRTFFVPKLCNHCANPPCVQVCPVGATFSTQDGVVLVDADTCIGCRYCIQACPYGARFLHPETRTASKCTFCYHRVVQGLQPACVEVCPTGARVFGELRTRSSPLARFRRFNKIRTLKPHLNTECKVSYANLDGEVE